MIVPTLLRLSSSDLEAGVLPSDPTHCAVQMTATVGPGHGSAGDNFEFLVATPSGLAAPATFGWGRGILIVESFSWEDVERAVSRLLSHAARSTWHEVAQELNKEMAWEFDNYQTA